MASIYCYDPTVSDEKSKVRGVGRYLQTLKENFPDWNFTNKLEITRLPARQGNSKLEIFINPFFNFLQTPLTLKRLARKQIAVIHDLIPLKYPEHFPVGIKGKLNIFLNKFALKNYDVIVTDSEASKEDIVRMLKVKSKKVKVIYPCLTKIFTLSHPASAGDSSLVPMLRRDSITRNDIRGRYCLYVGDATWNKNLVNIAKAIKEINVTCVFVGKVFEILKSASQRGEQVQDDKSGKTAEVKLDNGWQKELKEFIQMTNCDKRFIFSGFIPDRELIQLYQNAQCNILVSHDEGFGFSYLETASLGCPSILSDIPVLKEISASKGALFADAEKPDDIAHAIGEIYFNNEIRNKLGNEARIRNGFYSYSKFVQGWSKILV